MKNFQNRRKNPEFTADAGNWLQIAVSAALGYLAIRYALPLLLPFFLGMCIASTVQKPAALLSARIPRLSRRLCCVILTSAVILMLTAALYFAFCSLMKEAMDFCPAIPERIRDFRRSVYDASRRAEGTSAWNKFTSFAASGADRLMNFLAENYRDYLPSVLSRSTRVVSGLPSLAAAAVFTLLSALFACGDFQGVGETVRQFLPEKAARGLSRVIKAAVTTMSLLLRTYGVILLVTFCELVAGLGLMALTGHRTGNIVTISLVIALIDILPVLGTGTVLIPWGLFQILSGEYVSGIMLFSVFAVIETVRSVLEPKLIAGRLKLHPFFTLAGVYIGGKLFGAMGIFVMPFAMMTAKTLTEEDAVPPE